MYDVRILFANGSEANVECLQNIYAGNQAFAAGQYRDAFAAPNPHGSPLVFAGAGKAVAVSKPDVLCYEFTD